MHLWLPCTATHYGTASNELSLVMGAVVWQQVSLLFLAVIATLICFWQNALFDVYVLNLFLFILTQCLQLYRFAIRGALFFDLFDITSWTHPGGYLLTSGYLIETPGMLKVTMPSSRTGAASEYWIDGSNKEETLADYYELESELGRWVIRWG